jgi:ATP-dependent Clp protease ATP-binding subunit ClpA
MIKVVEIRLHEVEVRLKAQKKLKLDVDQAAKDWMAAAGFILLYVSSSLPSL